MQRRQQGAEHALLRLQSRFIRARPRLEHHHTRIDLLAHRLRQAGGIQLGTLSQRLQQAAVALEHLNPEATVARGYTIVRDAHGAIVSRADQLAIGTAVSLQLAVGRASARIENTEIAPTPISSIDSPNKPD
jgi:exodeoxyribonuclease VII large subunit